MIVGDCECPSCAAKGRDKTKNHLIIYSNGNKYCNRCGYKEIVSGTSQEEHQDGYMNLEDIAKLPSLSLPDRKLNSSTLEHYKVKVEVDEANGQPAAHYYPVCKDGAIVGYKKRTLPKTFVAVGNLKGTTELFGQSSCPKSGKRLLITGGELDALSAYQMLKEKYPAYNHAVVSLPWGEKPLGIKENLPFINSFEEVILYTDMDSAGRTAADNIAKLIGPKAKIMKTSEKDASDMLTKGKKVEFISAFYDAESRKPDGIISGKEISLEHCMKPTVFGYESPYPVLNKMIGGLKKGELTTLTAGSGIGKSTLARELGFCLRADHNLIVGDIRLEESVEKTIQGYVALYHNIPLNRLRKQPELLSTEQWQEAYDKLIKDKWFGFKHFGSMPTEDLLDKMRYLAYGEHCDFIILDHLSLVISGNQTDNERKDLDIVMTELAAFVNESGCGIISVVHLSRNKSKASFNEGGNVSLNDLRGSAALEQLSWNVIALERNQQGADSNESRIRVLKSREEGWTGVADTCKYDFDTGRLLPIEAISLSGDY